MHHIVQKSIIFFHRLWLFALSGVGGLFLRELHPCATIVKDGLVDWLLAWVCAQASNKRRPPDLAPDNPSQHMTAPPPRNNWVHFPRSLHDHSSLHRPLCSGGEGSEARESRGGWSGGPCTAVHIPDANGVGKGWREERGHTPEGADWPGIGC